MKNNKVLIIIAVILLNVLVVFMVGQSLLGKTSEYDKKINEARALAESELCSRSLEVYNEALGLNDTLEIRLEMIEVYEKGLSTGELTGNYDFKSSINTMVEKYREEPKAYEAACKFFLYHESYDNCANVLMTARDLMVTSEKIEEYREQVRYLYTKNYGMYTEILPLFDGIYTVQTKDSYAFLNEEGSANFDASYLYASSFSEGFAFVKSTHADGSEISFIIDKDGQRQAYLEGVEISSGVGKAQNGGKETYLLACKVGDKYKYYNIDGKEVFGDYKFAGRFRNGVAAVEESKGKWKLINGDGKAIVDTTFSDVILNEFDECAPKGLIFAKSGDKYHIYNLDGKQVGEFSCDSAKAFVDGYAAFKQGDLWGFVDESGKVIIDAKYEDAKSFSNSMGAVKLGGSWNFISPSDKVIIQETFEDVDYLNSKGVCFVKSDGHWSFLKMYYTGK